VLPAHEEETLALQSVEIPGDRGTMAVRKVSFAVHAGEIFGLAGVSGNGQRELAEAVLGLRRCTAGRIMLSGEDISTRPTRGILRDGVAFIPDDPLAMGVAPGLTVKENFILTDPDAFFSRANWARDRQQVDQTIQERIENLGLTCPPLNRVVITLSGGNVQRLLLSRELSRKPKLVVACQPTRGLDLAATRLVHDLFLASKTQGTAILLISEDLEELFALSDRIGVMYRGELAGVFQPREMSMLEVGRLMTGSGTRNLN
jgi:simple sugar transport system ATP-binding protein